MASWLLQVGQLPPFQPRSNTTSTSENLNVSGTSSRNETTGSGLSRNFSHSASVSAQEESKEEISEVPEGAEELLLEEEDITKLAEAWEIISEASSGGTTIIISKPGSVRSLPSGSAKLSAALASGISGGQQLSIPSPFTLQRSLSNSTIASEDAASITMSGCYQSDIVYGIPGVDYVEHVVMPTDTLQGVCLSYKVSATRLRQANQFSGNTLLLAPKKLIIPLSKNGLKNGAIRMQDRTTKEFKLQALMAEFTDLGLDDAKRYLTTSQWDLDGAIRSAGEDGEWEKASIKHRNRGGGHLSTPERKSGDIHITLKVHKGSPIAATIRGSGQRSRLSSNKNDDINSSGGERSG